jgi:hypothetical protein
LRVVLLVITVVLDILWLTKEQVNISKTTDAIILSVGFVIAVAIGLWVYFDIAIFKKPKVWNETGIEIKTNCQSGLTFIKDDELIWENHTGQQIVTIPLNKVKVIGEYTTSDGPYADDWFYLFILSPTDLRQVSAYAANISAVLESMSSRYKCEIVGHLAHSTAFDSNVLCPSQLRGTKVYETTAEHKPTTIWQRVLTTFGLTSKMGLTDDLRKYLG